MVLATDTLRFLPGDSASTTLTVIVSDRDGNVMEGQKVYVSLGDPSLGYLEFLDPVLQDTTNAQGRVNLLFTAVGIEGDMIFTATAGNIWQSRQLAIRAIPTMIEVRIDTVQQWASPGQDWLYFEALYSTASGTPLAGRRLSVTAWAGRFIYLSPTNDFGIAEGFLYSNDEFGEICITVTDGYAEGTNCVVPIIGGGISNWQLLIIADRGMSCN